MTFYALIVRTSRSHAGVMNITVIGASAGTGAQVVSRLADDNHHVVAFSRRGGSDHANVVHRRGDATEPTDVRKAVAGADAVIVTLGAPARDQSHLRERATSVIIDAMKTEGVTRLLVQSSLGVGDSRDLLPWVTKYVVVPLFLRRAFADHQAQEQLVRTSGMD
jgi:putative NADH-flavin reductase